MPLPTCRDRSWHEGPAGGSRDPGESIPGRPCVSRQCRVSGIRASTSRPSGLCRDPEISGRSVGTRTRSPNSDTMIFFRENPGKVYSSIAHNVQKFASRRLLRYLERPALLYRRSLPLRTRPQICARTLLTKIPEILENTWIRLAVGELAKVGAGAYDMNVMSLYGQRRGRSHGIQTGQANVLRGKRS